MGLAAEPVGAALHPFTSLGLTPYSCCKHPAHVDCRRHRIFRHAATLALQVFGALMPFSVLMKKKPWRNTREGNTGIAMNGRLPLFTSVV